MIHQTLNGNWVMNEKGTEKYLDAVIPGSVMSTLLLQRRIEDPFYRLNEYKARELFRKDYFFYREFEVLPELVEQERIRLVCEGIDTMAKIYINDMYVGRTTNMHRTWIFDVKNFLRPGINFINIEFTAPITYIESYRTAVGKNISYVPTGCMKGNQFMRKAHCMFGWDWGAQIPDLGIWRNIILIGYSLVRLKDVEILQHHEPNKVMLEVNVEAEVFRKNEYIIHAELETPDGKILAFSQELDKTEAHILIEIDSPQLWWPNGLGSQPLYTLTVFALDEMGNQWDAKSYRLGLRTLTVSMEKDEWGNEFCFMCNGVKFFAMGGNYIPEDTIYSFITKKKIDYLLKACVRSNFNTIRVWGGGYYPSDDFYDLCDEYGLVVWQDLMFACNVYEVTDDFAKNIAAEATDNVKRLRHHASLGLWCGNNENESAWVGWPDVAEHSDALRKDYIKQFEEILPKAVLEADKQRIYWPSSPSSGGGFDNPSDENRGDCHYWDVWHGSKPFTDYRNHYFRFCSEFGFQSFPSIKTIKTFTEESDRNIFSKVMDSHQKNEAANGKLLYYLSENFLYPQNFEDLLYVTQILQGMAVKYGVEHWRRNRGRCMGALYWQINDSWPVASWASIDYFGRWKPLQYMAKNFFAPVAGSLMRTGTIVAAYIQNETMKPAKRKVAVRLQTMTFGVLFEETYEVEVAPFSVECVCEVDFEELVLGREDSVFVEATFEDEDENLTSEIETFVPYKHLQLEKTSIAYSIIDVSDEYVIRMMSSSLVAFVELDLKQADAVFSENYFHMSSKREKAIILKKSEIRYPSLDALPIQSGWDLEQQLVIRSLSDTY